VVTLVWEIIAEHGTVIGYVTVSTNNFALLGLHSLAVAEQFKDKFMGVGCVAVAGVFHMQQADKVL
jgi:hypothetical protein